MKVQMAATHSGFPSVTGNYFYQPNNSQQHSASSYSEGIVSGPQRKQNESTKFKPSFLCLLSGHDCGFMQKRDNKVFKNCAELKEDLIRHLNLFQCERCLRRFGKKYGLDRHLAHTKRCRKGRKIDDRMPIPQVSKQTLKKIQDAKKYEKIAEAAKECFPIHPDSVQHNLEQLKAACNEKKNRASSSPMDPALNDKKEFRYHQDSPGSAGVHPDSPQYSDEQGNEERCWTLSPSPPNTPQHQPDSLEHPSLMDPPLNAQVGFEYGQGSSTSADVYGDSLQHNFEQQRAAVNGKEYWTSSSPHNTTQHQPGSLEYLGHLAPVAPMDHALNLEADFEYQQESSMSADVHPDSPSPPNTPQHQPGPLECSAPVAPMNHDPNVQMIPVPDVTQINQQESPMSADDSRMPAQGNGEAGSSFRNDTYPEFEEFMNVPYIAGLWPNRGAFE